MQRNGRLPEGRVLSQGSDQVSDKCRQEGVSKSAGIVGVRREQLRHVCSGGLCCNTGRLATSQVHSLDPEPGPISSFYGWN